MFWRCHLLFPSSHCIKETSISSNSLFVTTFYFCLFSHLNIPGKNAKNYWWLNLGWCLPVYSIELRIVVHNTLVLQLVNSRSCKENCKIQLIWWTKFSSYSPCQKLIDFSSKFTFSKSHFTAHKYQNSLKMENWGEKSAFTSTRAFWCNNKHSKTTCYLGQVIWIFDFFETSEIY